MGDPRTHPAPLPVGHPIGLAHCQPPPTTTTKSTLRWPSTACASFERQAPTSGRRRAVMDMPGDHADPAIPATRRPAPPPHPGTSFPSDTADAGTHGRRRPDTGHLDASDARTGHRSHGQAPHGTPDARTGHWTPDAGHERGHGDDSPAGIRTSLAATPSDRTLRRATCLCSCTTSRLLGHAAGQAAPRRTALVCWSWMVRGEGNGTTER
jgi:hypothetical protein